MNRQLAICLLAWTLAWPGRAVPQAGPLTPSDGGLIDLRMYRDPALELPEPEAWFPPGLLDLWLAGLQRPEADERRQAAEAIAAAHRKGMPGLDRATEPLMRITTDDPKLVVRATAARALNTLDDPAAAAALIEVAKENDVDLVLAADDALARWNSRWAYLIWRDRVADADAPIALRRSAMAGLARVVDADSIEVLLQAVDDAQTPTSLRIAAATAAGQIINDGLADRAKTYAKSGGIGPLLAARLLAGHTEPNAAKLAEQLAMNKDVVVSAEALLILRGIDPRRAVSLSDRVTSNNRPRVRLEIAKAHGQVADDAAVAALIQALDDPSLDVRGYARDRLIELAGDPDGSGGEAVRRAVATALADPTGWRQAEQAALAAGRIDLDEAAEALVGQLSHPRPEARLAAADALRRIEAADALPGMLEHAARISKRWEQASKSGGGDRSVIGSYGDELTQLFQAFGTMRYEEAQPLLMTFVPKSKCYGSAPRAAAIYALGLINQSRPNRKLASQLVGRLGDIQGSEPESDDVRQFSAIALGRMKSEPQARLLREFAEEEAYGLVGAACRWSLEQITGQPQPAPDPLEKRMRGWYLQPLDESER